MKIARLYNDKVLKIKGQLIEVSEKVRFSSEGNLMVNELIEGVELKISNGNVMVFELIENVDFKTKPIIDDNLVLWLDSKTGSGIDQTWEDLSGKGNNVSLYNFDFDGLDGWVDGALRFDNRGYGLTKNEIDFGNAVTFESCFITKNYVTGASTVSNLYRTVSGFSPCVMVDNIRVIHIDSGGVQRTVTVAGAATNADSPTHFAAIYDNGHYSFYLNGKPYATRDVITITGSSQIAIGRWAVNHPYYPFDGDIFMVRVYNRVLTAEEILHNYKSAMEGGV